MEKNNYNIKHNLKNLSSEDISKHMDFDALLQNFEAAEAAPPPQPVRTKVRRLWQIGIAVAAILVGLLAYNYLFFQNTSNFNATQELLASQPYVNPPIESAVPQFASYKANISEYKGDVVVTKRGSKIVIPPKAFTNRSGNFAFGEIDIKYREYHDFIDFFMSGIPMEYDSAGVNYILESAGMIEVYAELDGERLDMAPEKSIDIELYSEINVKDPKNPPSYNIYKLDTQKRNWVYQGVDDMEVLEQVERALDVLEQDDEATAKKGLEKEIAAIDSRHQSKLAAIEASVPQPQKPVRPTRANSNNFSFDLDIFNPTNNDVSTEHAAVSQAQQEIADLQKQYEGIIWEVLPNQPQFNESTAQVIWEDFKLDKSTSQDYVLTLIGGTKELKVSVKPVLMGEDFDNATANFEAEMLAFNQQMAARDAQLAERKAELAKATRIAKETANKAYEEKVAALKAAGQADKATDEMFKHKVLNRFTISSFGVWNCDRPLPPFIFAMDAKIQDQFNKKYKGNIAYFVDKKRNTVNRFAIKDKTVIRFDKTAENLMWLITKDNKLAVYRPEDFDKINYKEKDQTLVLNLVDTPIEGEEDVEKILSFD